MSQRTFSAFIVEKRDDLKLSNSKLAALSNISAVYLGEIINNKKPSRQKTQYA